MKHRRHHPKRRTAYVFSRSCRFVGFFAWCGNRKERFPYRDRRRMQECEQ